MAASVAELVRLRPLLQQLGYNGELGEVVLYPGSQRRQLVDWLMTGLLCGRSVDSIPLADQGDGELLSEEERFAYRCQQMLQMMGVQAKVDDLRGVGPEHTRCKLLFSMAELYQAAIPHQPRQQQQSSTGNLSARGSTSTLSVAGSTAASTDQWQTPAAQLLDWLADHASELTSQKVKLFPTDLNPVLEKYKGAQHALPTLMDQVQAHMQQLEQQAAAAAATSSTSSSSSSKGSGPCQPPAAGPEWDACMGNVNGGLQQLISQLENLLQVYQQELGVWAKPVDDGAEAHLATVGTEIGRHAKEMMLCYKNLRNLISNLTKLKDYHGALADVNQEWLQDKAAEHKQEQTVYEEYAMMLRNGFDTS